VKNFAATLDNREMRIIYFLKRPSDRWTLKKAMKMVDQSRWFWIFVLLFLGLFDFKPNND
jgi:hypothetical protein